MIEIVGVRFKNNGKIYYFAPDSLVFNEGEPVIVETNRGLEYGIIATTNKKLAKSEFAQELKKVVRKATDNDLIQLKENEQEQNSVLSFCQSRIDLLNLDMHLIRAEYTFDRSKVLIYFTSDGRVDFRQLVKDLASKLRTRIELRQIGVRDEAKMLGGLGPCGREFCCSSFLDGFSPVSIKMAKTQGLSLNPTKISGTCGRLMCCLNYEQEAYESLLKTTPKVNSIVKTSAGSGKVVEANLLTGMLKVQLKDKDGTFFVESFPKKLVTFVENK